MYIRKVEINNIRSIQSFQMSFDEGHEAGWHVLIGANGSGKSTILRSIALGIVGPYDAKALRQNWNDWVRKGEDKGFISLEGVGTMPTDINHLILGGDILPKLNSGSNKLDEFEPLFHEQLIISKSTEGTQADIKSSLFNDFKAFDETDFRKYYSKMFSVAYGPFRRFSGGEKEWSKVFYSEPRAAAHLSVFGEDVALSEPIEWLQSLDYKSLKGEEEAKLLLDKFRLFFKNSGLLPFNTVLKDINSDGVTFEDGNGVEVDINQLSDGFRSILSLTFELIRQLIRVYGSDVVFKYVTDEQVQINMPGVVMIDEIDAHLHPSWQKEIGRWFTRVFPNIQFIVTTHSPIICRSAVKGSIWYLPAPGSDESVRKLEGEDYNRMIYGTITDAYATDKFGIDIFRSEEAKQLLGELSVLDAKELFGTLTDEDKVRLEELRKLNLI